MSTTFQKFPKIIVNFEDGIQPRDLSGYAKNRPLFIIIHARAPDQCTTTIDDY